MALAIPVRARCAFATILTPLPSRSSALPLLSRDLIRGVLRHLGRGDYKYSVRAVPRSFRPGAGTKWWVCVVAVAGPGLVIPLVSLPSLPQWLPGPHPAAPPPLREVVRNSFWGSVTVGGRGLSVGSRAGGPGARECGISVEVVGTCELVVTGEVCVPL